MDRAIRLRLVCFTGPSDTSPLSASCLSHQAAPGLPFQFQLLPTFLRSVAHAIQMPSVSSETNNPGRLVAIRNEPQSFRYRSLKRWTIPPQRDVHVTYVEPDASSKVRASEPSELNRTVNQMKRLADPLFKILSPRPLTFIKIISKK